MNASSPESASLLELLVHATAAIETNLAVALTRPDGWTPTAAQLAVLRELDSHGRITVTGLAASVGITSQSMGEQVRRLEAREVVVVAGGSDRRSRSLTLAPHGRQLLRAARGVIDSLESTLDATLGGDDVATLRRALAALPRIVDEVG